MENHLWNASIANGIRQASGTFKFHLLSKHQTVILNGALKFP